jgi:hypothetical protein
VDLPVENVNEPHGNPGVGHLVSVNRILAPLGEQHAVGSPIVALSQPASKSPVETYCTLLVER